MLKTFIMLVLCQTGLLSGIRAACVVPDRPEKGTYSIVGSLDDPVPGSTMEEFQLLVYDCPAPNILQGGTTTICENGIWKDGVPTCFRRNTCVVPKSPILGSYFFPDSEDAPVAGSTAKEYQILRYDCPAPNILLGGSVVYCKDGSWLPEFPSCVGNKTCTLPLVPVNGSIINSVGDVDHLLPGIQVPSLSSVEYSCDELFELTGTSNITCNDGSWSSEPPQCQKTTACVVPDAPAKGGYWILRSPDAPVAGSTVEEFQVLLYDCPAPNILQGAPLIYCKNGKWLPEISSCVGNETCTLPAVPINGRIINYVGDVDHLLPGIQVPSLSSVEYSCDELFELTGNDNITCLDGSWSSEPPHCQRTVNCILPDLPKAGSYSIVGSVEAPVPGAAIAENKALRYNCTIKNGCSIDQVIVCSDGKWLPGVVECFDTPADCGDILSSTSGIYTIQPTMKTEPFDVFCDLTLAGQKWTVIQQRLNGEVNFNRSYEEYSDGFGSKPANHWLGLEHIHEITKGGHHELYIELVPHNGTKAYARYETFIVGNSSTGFQLTISGYSGTAGDSMTLTLLLSNTGDTYNNGMKFSTFDKDQDKWLGNCAEYFQGGWWHNSCSASNLNGPYHDTADWNDGKTMFWNNEFGRIGLKTARMLIRRK